MKDIGIQTFSEFLLLRNAINCSVSVIPNANSISNSAHPYSYGYDIGWSEFGSIKVDNRDTSSEGSPIKSYKFAPGYDLTSSRQSINELIHGRLPIIINSYVGLRNSVDKTILIAWLSRGSLF